MVSHSATFSLWVFTSEVSKTRLLGFFQGRISLYTHGCLRIHSVDQSGYINSDWSVFAAQELGLKTCSTTPTRSFYFYIYIFFFEIVFLNFYVEAIKTLGWGYIPLTVLLLIASLVEYYLSFSSIIHSRSQLVYWVGHGLFLFLSLLVLDSSQNIFSVVLSCVCFLPALSVGFL